ncbi:MAG: hypothetical protein KDC34_13180 [Saprospiraceae bacterium]|nr:hypothetical protein [Saprospiraceae bacterium]
MTKSKIKEIAGTLDKKERIAFRKYLDSPYFNKRADVVILWNLIEKDLQKAQSGISKEQVFQQVYPGKAYLDRDFHLLRTYLLKHLENFLAIRQMEKMPLEKDMYLLQSLKQKNIRSRQATLIDKIKKAHEKQAIRDTTYYERKRDLLWEEYQIEVAERPSGNLYLGELMELTDIAYYSRKLRQVCLLVAHKSVYRVQDAGELERSLDFLPQLEAGKLLKLPAIGVYYYGYLLFRDRNVKDHFQKFKGMLFDHSSCFDPSELRELVLMAINYCVRLVNDGDRSYFPELLELYQLGLVQDILLDNGQLSRFTYHNVVATGLQVQQYDWVKTFINDYQSYLEEAYQEPSFLYNMARLEFETGNLDSAQERLIQTHFNDILLNLAAKTISLKIYYQQAEHDLLLAHLHAMNKFVRRNKVIGYHKKNYLNIVRYATKLINTNKFDREARNKLREEILAEEILTEKNWLLEQLIIN